MLAFRGVAELGSSNHVHVELLLCLGPEVQVHLQLLWYLCEKCGSVFLFCEAGTWVSGAYHSDSNWKKFSAAAWALG